MMVQKKGNERFVVVGVLGNVNATSPEDDRISLVNEVSCLSDLLLLYSGDMHSG